MGFYFILIISFPILPAPFSWLRLQSVQDESTQFLHQTIIVPMVT